LRDPGPAQAGHRAGRGPGPAQPRRHRRLASRRRYRPSAQRRGDGPAGRGLSPVVENAAMFGEDLAFDLNLVAPKLPAFQIPEDDGPIPEPGHTEMSWLRELTMRGARERYGPPSAHPKAYAQIEYELKMIEELNFPGY